MAALDDRSFDDLDDLDEAAVAYAGRRLAEPGRLAEHRAEFTVACLPFAGRLARRFRGRGENFEDLQQVARVGLIKAIDRYEPGRGSFTAYAVLTINGEIKRHFRDRTWDVHVPRGMQDLSIEVRHAALVMTGALARTPTVSELAHHLRVSESAVRAAQGFGTGWATASLNAPAGLDGAAEVGDLLGATDTDLELVDDRVTVTSLLLRLPARERRMLALRFYGNHTQSEIAAELGVSQMHVSRLLSRALGRLREAMLSDTAPDWDGGSGGELRVSVAEEAGVLTVTVRGEVDRDNAARLRSSLRHAVTTAGRGIVVDLTAMPLVDAAGVAVLLDIASAAARAELELALVGAQPYAAKVMAASGLSTLLK